MPTYEYACPENHTHEIFCSISSRPTAPACPSCGEPCRQVFLTAPHVWKGLYVFDYPGSKVSVGAGGALNPKSQELHPIAHNVIPDRVRPPGSD
jgi:putative FmdB family regulatory protein